MLDERAIAGVDMSNIYDGEHSVVIVSEKEAS
jgi:hypothetical protein